MMFEVLQAVPPDLPTVSGPPTAPWGESIADEVMWIGLFTTIYGLGRRYLIAEYLPSARDINPDDVVTDRNAMDRYLAWVLYALGTTATTYAAYLLSSIEYALVWFGFLAFLAAIVALWGYRGGTPIDDARLFLAAKRNDDS